MSETDRTSCDPTFRFNQLTVLPLEISGTVDNKYINYDDDNNNNNNKLFAFRPMLLNSENQAG